jgi:arylesterase / paraoxonase
MTPLGKSALTWLVVLCLVAAGFAVRYEMIQGFLTPLNPVSPGICRSVATGLSGPEDFAIDPVRNVIFISSNNRQAARPSSDPRDGIYLMKLTDLTAPPVKLTGVPLDFHPHGVGLYRAADGGETLMAIDDKPNGPHLIEIYGVKFDGDNASLSQQVAIRDQGLVSPNDLAAIAPDHFYVTNDHATTSALGRFAEDYLLWPHADVLTFNGMGLRIAIQRIAAPSGILAKNGFLYVTARNERRLLAFSIQDFTGNLTEIGSLSMPARLRDISQDSAGNLIIAGQTKPGSAQVFRIKLGAGGIPQSYETIFSDDGYMLANASSAAIWNGHLFIGSSSDSKILDCDMK